METSTVEAAPHSLPAELTSFIGREREIAQVTAFLSKNRLVTLIGAGGAGKSRLALRAACALLRDFPDGVWLAELASLADPAFVPKALTSLFNIPEDRNRVPADTLVEELRSRSVLLVLDNCEHVLSACAQLATGLLRACPGLRILATSRTPLSVQGEALWRVPSLSLPEARLDVSREEFRRAEAVRLFVERAQAVAPDFSLTPENMTNIAQLCRRLDGMPLAIELAAARVKVLSVEQIAMRLDDRFRLLTGGSAAALPRHQTLRATMDWSYGLLTEEEKRLFRALSVFAGGWTLEAAAICAGDGVEPPDMLDLLARLVDKSLVIADTSGREARYRLLESVRDYGREKLREEAEAAGIRRRHRDFFVNFAELAEPELQGPRQKTWLERLDAEHHNMRAALTHCFESGGADDLVDAARLSGALWWFWYVRGHLREGRDWLDRASAEGRATATPAFAKVLYGGGVLACSQSDYARSATLGRASLHLSRQLQDKRGMAYSLAIIGCVAGLQGKYEEARALLNESLALSLEAGDAWCRGYAHNYLGLLELWQGNYGLANEAFALTRMLWGDLNDQHGVSLAQHRLGLVARYQGDYARAAVLLREALATQKDLRDSRAIAYTQRHLAAVAIFQGNHAEALRLYHDSLVQFREIGDRRGIVECLEGLAGLASEKDDAERAMRLFGAAEALREIMGEPLSRPDSQEYDHHITLARARLTPHACDAAYAEGRLLTLARAVEYALETGADERSPVRRGRETRDESGVVLLTAREREVAALVAEGMTNRQIATKLVITERTAETHVQNILNKLAFTSRAQVAGWAVGQRLGKPAAGR